VSQREAGELGLALELARQAQAKWPDYSDAKTFLAQVQPQATAAAQQASAQATGAAQAASAQATAAAQAQAAQAAAAAATAAAQPITITGRGQTATNQITPRSARSIAQFTHSGSRNFVVYVNRGSQRELLINTIGSYQGERPILGTEPLTFDIEADGNWSMALRPIPSGAAAPFSGTGDRVSGLFDPPAVGPWEFANAGRANFVVYLYCGSARQLIENRIGDFTGSATTRFGMGPCFWEVQSDGKWELRPRT
jgi:hypothetical protein